MNLVTFRKSGEKVSTPVWFALDGDRLVVVTGEASGKVKRIKKNPRVKIVPSDMRGKPLGDAVPAQARILPSDDAAVAENLLRQKYGLQFSMFGAAVRNNSRAFLEITPP